MPNYGVKQRQRAAERKLKRDTRKETKQKVAKQKQYDKYEEEFFRYHTARGFNVQQLGFEDKCKVGMREVMVVYRVKPGHKDPFDEAVPPDCKEGGALFSIDNTTDQVCRRYGVRDKKERDKIMNTGSKEEEDDDLLEISIAHLTTDELIQFLGALTLK